MFKEENLEEGSMAVPFLIGSVPVLFVVLVIISLVVLGGKTSCQTTKIICFSLKGGAAAIVSGLLSAGMSWLCRSLSKECGK